MKFGDVLVLKEIRNGAPLVLIIFLWNLSLPKVKGCGFVCYFLCECHKASLNLSESV